MLDNRLKVLSISLENASVEKSKQHDLVNKMKKELNETRGFIEVSSLRDQISNCMHYLPTNAVYEV